MENTLNKIIYRLDYLEFKQNLLILKEPCHKVSIFFDLNINIYDKMRNFSYEFTRRIVNGEDLNIQDYEKGITNIWPPISSYPSSYIIIAKSLLPNNIFKLIINSK